jgi:hypothetical protein
LREVRFLPFPLDDGGTDLRGSLAQSGLLKGKDGFLLADVTDGGVTVHIAIEQALVAQVLVEVAIAWLLVKDGFLLGCQRVDVLGLDVGE